MKKIIQKEIAEEICDQCGNIISHDNAIRLDGYYANQWETNREFCTVQCFITWLPVNTDFIVGIYDYHLSMNGDLLLELSKSLNSRSK